MEEKLLDLLVEQTGYEEIRLNRDIDMFKNGLIDSLGFINLIIELEQRFGVIVDPADVERTEIQTPNLFVKFVSERLEVK